MSAIASVENGVVVFRDENGVLLTPAQVAAAAPVGSTTRERIRRSLVQKVTAAITSNEAQIAGLDAAIAKADAFIAIANPTTAQRNAYLLQAAKDIKTLARDTRTQYRELTALSRLAIEMLDSEAGT